MWPMRHTGEAGELAGALWTAQECCTLSSCQKDLDEAAAGSKPQHVRMKRACTCFLPKPSTALHRCRCFLNQPFLGVSSIKNPQITGSGLFLGLIRTLKASRYRGLADAARGHQRLLRRQPPVWHLADHFSFDYQKRHLSANYIVPRIILVLGVWAAGSPPEEGQCDSVPRRACTKARHQKEGRQLSPPPPRNTSSSGNGDT